MTAKEYKRALTAARGEASYDCGFDQSTFINYMEKDGYFFCLYFFPEKAVLTVKPMYADELWWEIWHTPKNMKSSMSLRGRGVYSVPSQILASYALPDSQDCKTMEDVSEKVSSVFSKVVDEIDRFLIDNPFSVNFYPEESKMLFDPDRLLHLMALVRNMRYEEALDIIEAAKRHGHKCSFKCGPYIDSYTYIEYYCKGRTLLPKILDTLFRHDFFKNNSATQTYRTANAFLNGKPLLDTPWYKRIPTWFICVLLFAILFATSFASISVGYRTLYLTPKWISILGSLLFALIPILVFVIKVGKPSKDAGSFVFYLMISFFLAITGYFITEAGTIWFYAINYWFRDPEKITTTAVVTDQSWDYDTHEGHGRYRTHYVNVLELPEENREIKAVDGYIHCYPTGTEFDLVYSKGFFGIDILEGVDNVRYPSERYHMTTP